MMLKSSTGAPVFLSNSQPARMPTLATSRADLALSHAACMAPRAKLRPEPTPQKSLNSKISRYILTKADPGDPLDKDIYDLSPEEMQAVPSMPASLEEALTCLEEDHAFLLKGDVFTEELIETFVAYKRKYEADAIRSRPHPYEFALYYDI